MKAELMFLVAHVDEQQEQAEAEEHASSVDDKNIWLHIAVKHVTHKVQSVEM